MTPATAKIAPAPRGAGPDDRSAAGAGQPRTRVILVTGMSGAGHSTALKTLEDMGYEAVDNLPLPMLQSLAARPGAADVARPLAIGIDIRTRGFGADTFIAELDRLGQQPGLDVRLLFLDCDDEVLFRRYTETRRRHPLTADRPVADSVRHERQLVEPLRARADLVVDTTMLTAADLRRLLHGHFALARQGSMSVFVVSFSYRHGVPRESDLVFDVRFLDNPFYIPQLRPLSGRDAPVAEHIRRDPAFAPFFDGLTGVMKPLLPRYVHEGKSYLTIAVGCTGGRHRSVFVAERLAGWLNDLGYPVTLNHRDLSRGGEDAPAGGRA
ncbi:MAG: RNase adapter RapZ [Alphaproteobacteria bacterium]|nr:RNase adapter RapZ [Alphaproteobacteria bacterium]